MESIKKENLERGMKKLFSFNVFLHLLQDIEFFSIFF